MAQYGGNSGSFMRRNVLVTASNRSSISSIKSSFLIKGTSKGPTANKQSFQSNNDCGYINTCEDVEEQLTYNNHCCQRLSEYSLVPKTIFNEIVSGIAIKKNKESFLESKKARLSDLVQQADSQQRLSELVQHM